MIKALFVAGMIYKARKPEAPQQTWIIDECAQLGKFPLIIKLYSYGAGIGIRSLTVWQSRFQMKALGQDAENIIPSSAAMQIYFAIRDLETARTLSTMIGTQTLSFDHAQQQAQARHAKRQAVYSLLNGEDVLAAGLNYIHHNRASQMRTEQQRLLCTPDEVLNTAQDKAYIFTDALPKSLSADRKPYYEQRFMAGRHHPNPYHPPLDWVLVKTSFGKKRRAVLREPVPAQYAQYPQYRDGSWSYIEGYRS